MCLPVTREKTTEKCLCSVNTDDEVFNDCSNEKRKNKYISIIVRLEDKSLTQKVTEPFKTQSLTYIMICFLKHPLLLHSVDSTDRIYIGFEISGRPAVAHPSGCSGFSVWFQHILALMQCTDVKPPTDETLQLVIKVICLLTDTKRRCQSKQQNDDSESKVFFMK